MAISMCGECGAWIDLDQTETGFDKNDEPICDKCMNDNCDPCELDGCADCELGWRVG